MVADTTAVDRRNHGLADDALVWLFGYGSLIFKADFPYLERRPAHIEGWARRFWQGSHDHCGTPQAPGRVATLIEAPGAAICQGIAYRLTGATFAQLDYREKNGYLRLATTLYLDRDREAVPGLIYLATVYNPAFPGPATTAAIAGQIATAQGPSGTNLDYLLDLVAALRALGIRDAHVDELIAELPHRP